MQGDVPLHFIFFYKFRAQIEHDAPFQIQESSNEVKNVIQIDLIQLQDTFRFTPFLPLLADAAA